MMPDMCEAQRPVIETACCVTCPPVATSAPTLPPTMAPVVVPTLPPTSQPIGTMGPNDRPSDMIGGSSGTDRNRPTAAPTPPPTEETITEAPSKAPVPPTAVPTLQPTAQPTSPPVPSNPTSCDFCQGLGRGCFLYDFMVAFENGVTARCEDVLTISKELSFGQCLDDKADLESMCCPCKNTAAGSGAAAPTNAPVDPPSNPPVDPPTNAPVPVDTDTDRSDGSGGVAVEDSDSDEPDPNTVAGGGVREIDQMYDPNFRPGDSIIVENRNDRGPGK